MARINIYEELQVDPRFTLLCQMIPRNLAYGAIICLWELGQAYWKKKGDPQNIPRTLAEHLPNISDLVRCDFVRQVEDGSYYCAGSRERWAFLRSKSDAGKKSAEARQAKYGSAIPSNAPNLPNKRRTDTERAEPSSSSSSSSSKEEFKTNTDEATSQRNDPLADHMALGSHATERGVRDLLFNSYPVKRGWGGAWPVIRKLLAEKHSLYDMEHAVINYRKEVQRLKRPEDKIKSFPNFFKEGLWLDYVNPEKNEDFSKADNNDWEFIFGRKDTLE